MQGRIYPFTRDLVLIGGGHSHALVLRRWGMAPMPGVRVTLISPEPVTPYTGMLPGVIAGHYAPEAMQIDLVKLARFAGARLVLGRAVGIDRAAAMIAVPGRAAVGYDVVSLDIGVGADLPDLPGFAEWGHPARPLAVFVAGWEAALRRFAAGEAAEIAVLGGGPGGVELALAMGWRLKSHGIPARITVIEAGQAVLAAVGSAARRAVLAELAAAGIAVETGAQVVAVEAAAVVLAGGRRIASGFTVGAAGATPQGWLAETGLALLQGFVAVQPTLQSAADPAVFAVGDCAEMLASPRPKAGVFAVRQAPVLGNNLRAALTGGALRQFRPQRDYLRLLSMGRQAAVADKAGIAVSGNWVWRLKDRIDRRFMARFHHLPAATSAPPPAQMAAGLAELLAATPLCGGCGAKVGRGDLLAALTLLPGPVRADVISGPGDDAAVLRHGAGLQVLSTDHLRAFIDDPWLMTQIAALHALGDVWAMGAAPQVALAQITLPEMSARLQARTLAEINQAAAAVFGAAGADLVGGHTSLGAELTIGFTVTGLLEGAALGKVGAVAGDVLVLTRPIGAGVVLAAEMARVAPGAVVAGVWAGMVVPQGRAAAILARHASAMTDVTGFGLAGHLGEMLAASGVGAELVLAAVPLLPGAEALALAGVRSSLYPANRAAAPVSGLAAAEAAQPGRVALLFDPQTCGGLLAAIPAAVADQVMADLTRAGVTGVRIGRIVAGEAMISIRLGEAG